MPLAVIRDRSKESNQSKESGGEGNGGNTPKLKMYGTGTEMNTGNFAFEGDLNSAYQGKQKSGGMGVKSDDIEKIVEKVGRRLGKT